MCTFLKAEAHFYRVDIEHWARPGHPSGFDAHSLQFLPPKSKPARCSPVRNEAQHQPCQWSDRSRYDGHKIDMLSKHQMTASSAVDRTPRNG